MTVTKTDRQRQLMEIISARRFETIPNLASELGVSRYTIMRDLDEITDIASFYTVCGKHGGGVYQTARGTKRTPEARKPLRSPETMWMCVRHSSAT